MSAIDLADGAPLPVATTHLRARIRQMDSAARDACFASWGALPDLADETGGDVLLPADVLSEVEQHICAYEPHAGGLLPGLLSRYQRLEPGPRLAASSRLAAQGLAAPDALAQSAVTLGRAMTIERILDDVLAESEELVAEALGFVRDDGLVADQPVADAEALASYVAWSKMSVKELLAFVGDDAELAAAALVAERKRAKPRAGVMSKLEPMVATAPHVAPSADPEGALEPSAPAAAEAEPPSGPSPAADGEGVAVAAPPAAAPSAGPSLGKYAAMLGRLGAEMLSLARTIEADLQRVEL